jgi:predicted nucleotide-binding protein
MARRSTPKPPQDQPLTPAQMRSGIERLRRRVEELRASDPTKITTQRSAEIVKLETDIESTLAAIFGERTPRFNRYASAADLEPAPILSITPDWTGARGGGHGRGPNIHELQQGIAERQQRAIAILEGAIRALEEDIDHRVADDPVEENLAPAPADLSNKVFIVHGHAGEPREAVARFLARIGLDPIILHEQANQGKTIIEKFEAYASVGFAIVLLTPDDIGGAVGGAQQPRARQNVILELGYFIGRFTRGRVCALKVGDLELPSDIFGVVWTPFDTGGAWKIALAKELQAAGYEIDWNKVMA